LTSRATPADHELMSFERDNIRRLAPYEWGEQPDSDAVLKLNTNENPFPPSPAVARALAGISVDALRRYPPPTAAGLRTRLAALHGVDAENLVITNGGDEALRLALTTFVEPGSAFGMLEPSYSLYAVLARIQDARIVSMPLDEHWEIPSDFARFLNDAGANLACIVNPHAPSGTLLDADRIGRLASDFHGVLLVDEAYVDFVDPALRHDLVRLVNAFDNLLLLRTFSKGYSLAGLRLGYLIGGRDLIAPILTKTRDSYNIDLISQTLGTAAIADRAYAEETWRQVRRARRSLREGLLEMDLTVDASQTNFLLVTVGLDAPLSARELYQALKQQDILVRWFDTPALEDKLRITVGTETQNTRLLRAMAALLAGGRD
jgi:histidinol-phosphate aminotransferase